MAPEPKFLWDEMPVFKLNHAKKHFELDRQK